MQEPALSPVRALPFPSHPAHDVSAQAVPSAPGLAAVPVLKALLDRKLIESGLWNDARLEIGGSESSQLLVTGRDDVRRRVLAWMKEIGDQPPSTDDVAWAREAAIHRQDLPNIATAALGLVTPDQVQDAARIQLVN